MILSHFLHFLHFYTDFDKNSLDQMLYIMKGETRYYSGSTIDESQSAKTPSRHILENDATQPTTCNSESMCHSKIWRPGTKEEIISLMPAITDKA